MKDHVQSIECPHAEETLGHIRIVFSYIRSVYMNLHGVYIGDGPSTIFSCRVIISREGGK